ncbi:hypothetical protein JIG36_05310 [Actinoplanes sp. LDG1-06]|uniref:Uncharacterized protein n=1 Tax=Paractinoplanes ovalisporus TaxID=2810368 RepID=A0ABS2A568_9ACTN|nr:hypothetical protein [Actinoplanes ovalisporus]MBM2614977.1 hypothetical protein [Actinoplanes ovalisporus]
MPDVEDVLRNLTVAPGRTGPDVVAGDVARGRRAATRRSRQRLTIAGGFVAVVAAAAVGLTQVGPGSGSPEKVGPGSGSSARLTLVSYTGAQPTGFEVSTVPDGWKVVSSDPSSFVVEPPNRGDLPGDNSGAFSLEGRIAVQLQGESRFPAESPVTKVDVNGREGRLGHPLESEGKLSGTRWLFFPDATGRDVQVQVPESVGLTQEQIVDFAEGITVTAEAVEIGG